MPTALVTGAVRAPGAAVARALAAAGWTVHAMGRDRRALADLQAEAGIRPLALDLTDREAAAEAAAQIGPDALVHAALRWPPRRPLFGLRDADVDMALEVNLSAAIHLTRAAAPLMRVRGRGAVLTLVPGAPEGLVQEVAAAGLAAFAEALGREFAAEREGGGHGPASLRLGCTPGREEEMAAAAARMLSAALGAA